MAIYSGLVKTASAAVAGAAWLVPPLRGRLDGGLFGRFRTQPPELPEAPAGRIWIHAVSAGEVKVARTLISALKRLAPAHPIIVSTATDSGLTSAARLKGVEAHFLLPIDTVSAMEDLHDAVKPDALIVVEAELWPALFAISATRDVPIFIVNGRMSDKSAERHKRHPFVVRRSLRLATRIFAEDRDAMDRLIDVGANPNRIEVAGNIKLARPYVPAQTNDKPGLPAIRQTRPESVVVTFGNAHPQELPAIRQAIDSLLRKDRNRKFLIVPRHPERFSAGFVNQAFGDNADFVDDLPLTQPVRPITWVNKMGILADAYRRSDIGVVCGTFASVGGHDLAEPFHCGALAIYGPDIAKQKPLHKALLACNCSIQVADPIELSVAIDRYSGRPADRASFVDRFAWRASSATTSVDRIVTNIAARVRLRHPLS